MATATKTSNSTANWHRRHDLPWLVLFVVPALIIVVAVQFYPLAYSAFLSVQDWVLTESQRPKGFVGLENFTKELADDTFRRSVRNSVYITGGALALQMTLGICLAYLTMGASWRMRAIRTLLILPMVIAPVAAGTLWRILLNSRAGLVNHLLSQIGIKGPEWLASPDWAIVSVIMLDTWQWTPFVLLVVGAAIASIPEDLLEVAAIDGASRWHTFLYVELPLLMPLLLLTLVFRMLESLLSLDSIYSLTFGGPGYSTYTLTYYIYTLGLRSFNFGAAAASSWLFMIFASLSIGLVFWYQRRDW
ncbi:MAG: sugar ABC transporter permease [Chloroflexota bacterium]|nr:sugar ABC transporter permease [Chloroflexota bacterium]MDE2908039.1 sugar ABC transporter permease [Chloroflexota bacterium]